MPMDDERRLREWEQRGSVPLSIASLVFLVTYAVRVLAPDLPSGWSGLLLAITVVTWGLFVVDYLVRVAVAPRRWRYVRRHWLDLVVVVLPLLRPLRLLQLYAKTANRHQQPRLSLEARVMAYAGLSALLLGFSASLQVYADEHDAPGGQIRSYGDSVWWLCSTMTTTGYGDLVPVTARGRVVAVGVMFLGVVLIGAIVGSFSAWLTKSLRRDEDRPDASGSPEG